MILLMKLGLRLDIYLGSLRSQRVKALGNISKTQGKCCAANGTVYKRKIGKIAISVGFPSASILRRHYIDLFSLSPEEERKRVNLFRVNDNSPIPAT